MSQLFYIAVSVSQQADLASNIRRRIVHDFVEIDEKEYSTVSDFIKQRVKLFEVNVVSAFKSIYLISSQSFSSSWFVQ